MEWVVVFLPGAACVAMCAGCAWMMAKGRREHGRGEGEGNPHGRVTSSERNDG